METFILGLLAVGIGTAFCFAGYRLFTFLMPLCGFVVGFVIGATGVAMIFGEGFLATVTGWVVGFVVGLIGAALAYLFYWGAVVLLCLSVGYLLGAGLLAGLGLPDWLAFFGGIAVAAIALIAAIVLNVPELLLVLLTALGGGSVALGGFLLWFGAISVADFDQGAVAAIIRGSWLWLPIYLLLASLGILAQLGSIRSRRLLRTAYQY